MKLPKDDGMMDVGSFYMSPTQMKQEKITVSNAKWHTTDGMKFDVKPVVSIMDLGRSLLEAAREGDTERVHEYMAKGAPFTTDWLGTSPLHLAAKNNHLETCKVLLRGGLNKECKTKVERTPLHFAVSECNVDIVELLLAHKANPDSKDMLKMTPLHWAVEKQCEEIVELLLQNGANPLLTSKFGKTPIYMAAEKKNPAILAKLVQPTRIESIKQTEMATSSLVEEMNGSCSGDHKDATQNSDNDDIIEEDDGASSLGDAFMHFADPGGSTPTTTAAGIELLKEHGIHLMKDDDSNSVIQSALESGRRLILSEAGKFVLKNSLDTDVFPTTSKPNPLALSRPKLLRTKPLVPVHPQSNKKKIIQMSAEEYRQLFKRGTSTPPTGKFAMPAPPKVAKTEREVLEKLPQETTVTMQRDTPATIGEVDKQVQELRKECEDLRKQLEISQRQNQEYQRRLEKLEAIVLRQRPS